MKSEPQSRPGTFASVTRALRGPFQPLAALTLALGCGALPVSAQVAPAGVPPPEETLQLDEFVVNGARASLITAQETKRNSVQLIDSIAAQDIGKLPDNSVADALQHVPGIQVGRGNGEVGSVIVRGLPNIETTLNGHEIFTGTSRGVALQDIPAELVAGVDVYKTRGPDQVEGGIAGLIDIRLRRPLDFDGLKVAGGGRAIYGENTDEVGWVGNALISNRWKTKAGADFGLLLSASYQKNFFVDQTIFNFLFEPVPNGGIIPGQSTIQLPVTQGSLVIPGERRRPAVSFAAQWRPGSALEVYTDFLYTGFRTERDVHFLIGFPRFGAFQTATVAPGTDVAKTLTSVNNFHLTSTQAFNDRTDGYQGAFGLRWNKDRWRLNTDVVYNWSEFKNRVVIVDTQFVPPTPATFTFNFDNHGRADQKITGADITDGNNFRLWGLFDNHGIARGKQVSWRGDAEYTVDSGLLSKVKLGARITDRKVKNRQTSVNDIAPVGGRGNVRTSTVPGFGSISVDGDFSSFGTPNWFGANPDFLRNNAGTVRQLFGRPATDPAFNPTQSFDDQEKTQAGFAQAEYKIDVAGRPLEGVVGVRVVRTDQDLVGFFQSGTALRDNKKQTDVMPMFSSRLRLTDEWTLRFTASRTVTRPNFGDLNPIATLNAPTTTGGGSGTGSGGNPNLATVESDNYDLALEYYFDKSSYVSLTGFYRSIDGFVQRFAENELIDGTNFIVTRPRNAGKGDLEGFEATYQHFPKFLGGFGWQTNATYIRGDTDAPDTRPGAAPGARIRQDYEQVSKWSYNLIGIYERGKFSARLAYNWRGSFTDTFNGPNAADSPLRQIIVKSTDNLDFSASYQLTEKLTLTVDATNLLNAEYQDFFADAALYPRDTRAYDRTFGVGLRYRF